MTMNYISEGILSKDCFDGQKRFAECVQDMINSMLSSCRSFKSRASSCG